MSKITLKKSRVVVTALLVSAVAATPAFAALDASATSGFTAVSGAITDMIAAAWPPIAAIAVAMIGFKLFKRVTGKV